MSAFVQAAKSFARSVVPRTPRIFAGSNSSVSQAFVGVGTGVGTGVAINEANQYSEHRFLRDDASRIPESVSMLLQFKVTVPPIRLLDDLDWNTLTSSPLLLENPEIREEVTHVHERLRHHCQLQQMISPNYAIEILNKFGYWLDLHEIHLVLRASSEVKTAIEKSMEDVSSGMDTLNKMYDSSREHFRNGDAEKATDLAKRALHKADRINTMLSELHSSLKDMQEQDHERLKSLLLCAAVAGAGCLLLDHISADGALSSALVALQHFLGVSGVCASGYALYMSITSKAVTQYLNRVATARKQRNFLYHKLENLVDETVLHASF